MLNVTSQIPIFCFSPAPNLFVFLVSPDSNSNGKKYSRKENSPRNVVTQPLLVVTVRVGFTLHHVSRCENIYIQLTKLPACLSSISPMHHRHESKQRNTKSGDVYKRLVANEAKEQSRNPRQEKNLTLRTQMKEEKIIAYRNWLCSRMIRDTERNEWILKVASYLRMIDKFPIISERDFILSFFRSKRIVWCRCRASVGRALVLCQHTHRYREKWQRMGNKRGKAHRKICRIEKIMKENASLNSIGSCVCVSTAFMPCYVEKSHRARP